MLNLCLQRYSRFDLVGRTLRLNLNSSLQRTRRRGHMEYR